MAILCFSCGEDAILETDGSAGNSVLEENNIVSEITFGETGGGAAMVQGSYVGADQTRARAPAGYRQKGGGQESREQTMQNGRRRIQALATALRLPDRLSDAGQRYFNLAVNLNFVQGRRTQYVVATCLYCACRMDKTSHMLIDFSDLLEINVFVLGATYLKLVKELSLQLPTVDPSIFISRFAALLEFGDETQKVAQDATRLVARMGRDYMHTGRRPAGVCGACLFLAARMNNFRRSITEVVQVVKIADVTIRKRLGEFKDTPSGTLTVADFRTLWLEDAVDPPAFTKSQKREQKEREAGEERKQKKDDGESDSDQDEDDSVMGSVAGDADASGREAFAELAAGDASPEKRAGPSEKALGKRKRIEEKDDEDEDDPVRVPSPGPEDRVADLAIEAEFDKVLDTDNIKNLVSELDKKDLERLKAGNAMNNLNTSDRLDDLDEDELDMFILTDAEAEAKSRLWMEFNKDYLQALADKQTDANGDLKPEAKRRIRKRHKPRDSTTAQGTDAADATKQMFTKKRFSKKINYAAINGLFGGGKEGEDDGIDEPILGKAHGAPANARKRGATVDPSIARGKAIAIPMPTFAKRAGTPRQASEAPAAPAKKQSVPVPEPEPESGDEEPEVVVEEEEEEEEIPEWRRMMAGGGDDDGIGLDYDQEV
ncbi:hypothetical protein RQP46_000410 [Phenoliferia psychrophenolica]